MSAKMSRAAMLVGASLSAAVMSFGAARAADEDAARDQRWSELSQSVFGDRKIERTDGIVSLDTPKRAEDASLVPISIETSKPDDIKGVTLVIDDNPGPVAARITFGPAGDPSLMKLRTRVDTYTNIHAVAETRDGQLIQTANFVKASGGCSAPVGASADEALKGVGEMRLRVRDEVTPGKSARATLMIRHPNFNGMQMDQVSRNYTPAKFIKDIKVTYNDRQVFDLESDISLSSNPVIEFGFKPEAKGQIKVTAADSTGQSWEQSFDVPSKTN